jgi:hypothetical protein
VHDTPFRWTCPPPPTYLMTVMVPYRKPTAPPAAAPMRKPILAFSTHACCCVSRGMLVGWMTAGVASECGGRGRGRGDNSGGGGGGEEGSMEGRGGGSNSDIPHNPQPLSQHPLSQSPAPSTPRAGLRFSSPTMPKHGEGEGEGEGEGTREGEGGRRDDDDQPPAKRAKRAEEEEEEPNTAPDAASRNLQSLEVRGKPALESQ